MLNTSDSVRKAHVEGCRIITDEELNKLYKSVLDLLKQERIIDGTADTTKYTKEAKKDMGTPLTTYYKSQVKEKYGEEVFYNDSVFFLPVINRIFELTKI